MIDAYIADLDGALRGSRRAKRDLLTEARDSLVDVADAYRLHGLDREAAERRAVLEFGTVAELAPAYQAELGLAQGRRTALLVALVLVLEPLLWDYGWGSLMVRLVDSGARADAWAFIDTATRWLGSISIGVALVVAVGCRRPYAARLPFRLGRLCGMFAGAVAVVFSGLGLLAVFSGQEPTLATIPGLAAVTAFVLVPMGLIALSARRCLTT